VKGDDVRVTGVLSGGECPDGINCEAIYATNDPDVAVVVSKRTSDDELLAQLSLGADEIVGTIPRSLLNGVVS
jgi:hypothetical protein